jgi:hypothetical protein
MPMPRMATTAPHPRGTYGRMTTSYIGNYYEWTSEVSFPW